MKKVLLVIAAATAMAGCSQSEEFDNPAQKAEIGFNTIVNNATRAAEVNLSVLKDQGFHVYAYNTGTDVIGTGLLNKSIMENEEVTWNGSQWGAATYYWPSTGNVQFFAYSSKKSLTLTTSATDKYPTLVDYEIAATAADQEDLLVATASNKSKVDVEVDLTFSHVLTQINFSIKAKVADGLTYTVSKIEIGGVNNKGTYQYVDNSWVSLIGDATYEYPLAADKAVVGTEAKAIGSESLMLLPQTSTTRKILVSYSVTDKNGDEVYATGATPKEVDLGSAKWDVSKRIRYTLSLTNDATPIGWDVTDVNGWTDETGDKEPVDPTPAA